MSLSTALSLETLSPDELFDKSEKDLGELWAFYDANNNGVLELEELTTLVSEVLGRMQAQLPAQIPAKYCALHHLAPAVLEGIEGRILEKIKGISRPVVSKKLFDELDTNQVGFLEPNQLKPLHRLMETHVLKDLYESINVMIVQKQLSAYDHL